MGQHILVIGSGGREHAIAYALLRSPLVSKVTVAPGNPGMGRDDIDTVAIDPGDVEALLQFIDEQEVSWVFIGPEQPLIDGLADTLRAHGIQAFGPSKAAAQIEGSKDFAKRLMARHHIPTAAYTTCTSLEEAQDYVRSHGAPIVVKADGLAAGKGVTVAMDEATALDALHDIFVDHKFGKAGASVVLEDYLEGQEFSLMSFVDGRKFWPMPIAQDHKRAYDGDKGPNTGGMGAYSPVPQIGEDTVRTAIDTIVAPTVQAMADEGTPFTGILYAGLIATKDGPQVIEFNARFGDPETQVVLPRLTSDLACAITAIFDGEDPQFTWDESEATIGVVVAAEGYPGTVRTGAPIPSIPTDDSSHVYYAGVARDDSGQLVSSSGRVFLVEQSAPTLKEARQRVYERLDASPMDGLFYRHDIGAKALNN